MRLLLVEDEREMADMITMALRKQDIVVDVANDLEVATEAAKSGSYDVVILDRQLPDGEGLTLVKALKTSQSVPGILVLSAQSAPRQRVEGLNRGADDYLSKPFVMDELVARVWALRRRPALVTEQLRHLGNLTYHVDRREFTIDGEALVLPRREFLVLETLLSRSGRSVTRTALEEAVFGFEEDIASNTLDAHVSRLRKKLSNVSATVEICAIRGVGYLIRHAN